MYFCCMLLFIVILAIVFPYIRCFFKRLVCADKIKRICRKKSYKLHKTHPLWFLGNKRAKKCDCYIETRDEVFSIKFFGIPRRLTVLIFKENGEYYIRSFIAVVFAKFSFNNKPKFLPAYDFRHKYRNEWEIKTPHNILLVNPISMEIRRQSNNGEEIIVGAGEIVNGMEIDSLPRLIGDLENAI